MEDWPWRAARPTGAGERADPVVAALDDVEAVWRGERALEDDAAADEAIRAARSSLALVDRWRANVGMRVELRVVGAGAAHGTVQLVGTDHVAMTSPSGELLVAFDAVVWARGLGPYAVDPATIGRVAAAVTLSSALRRWVRERRPVTVTLRDGSAVHGTLERAAADHVDVVTHPVGALRRADAVHDRLTVPYAAIATIVRD